MKLIDNRPFQKNISKIVYHKWRGKTTSCPGSLHMRLKRPPTKHSIARAFDIVKPDAV